METGIIILLLLSPLVGFMINMCVGKKMGESLSGKLATTTVVISFALSVYYFIQILATGEAIHVPLFEWFRIGDYTIDFKLVLDQLSLTWLLFVTGIGALIHIYSIAYMKGDGHIARYFAYLNLFIFFMILLVVADNLLVMFIGWEGVGLCSYLLIGFWHQDHKNNDAAKKAFVMNRIGDLGFLIGTLILLYILGTVDFATMSERISGVTDPPVKALFGVATFALFVGAMGKSAQIPLYTWLPDAMAGPTPVSALIHAATMVTAGIFMITRLNFLFDITPDVQYFIAIIGAVTALFAASIAVLQTDIKKILAYSTVSQLGLMFLAIGCGAYHIAVFHVITHAFFKACLFLGAGSVIHANGGEQDIRKMGGLKAVMGITFVTFLLSTFSIAGIPPFAGFFSKDEIMMVAFQNSPILWAVGALASLLTAFYMFRVLFLTFYGQYRGSTEQKQKIHESPKTITIPLIILGTLALVGGIVSLPFGLSWLNDFLTPVIPSIAFAPHATVGEHSGMMAISTLIAFVGLGIAYYLYIKKEKVPGDQTQLTALPKLIYNKYYVNELYNTLFVKPLYRLATVCEKYVEKGVSYIVAATAKIIQSLSIPFSSLQNGSVGVYLFCFVLGFCFIVCFVFFGIIF